MDHRLLQQLLKAIGGGSRLGIVAYLRKHHSASVSHIAQVIHRSVTTSSIHLSHLERLGIIERRRRGQEVFYRLSLSQNPLVKNILKEI
ncbi:MAG TPA: metalloregulator ArsR/SmtB family transcription factor [Candidatus Peribacterales bacterium]|nr:metalloregulator ArsR/SmtB family transcription factor [Candidatus Peribacterales bacterium]